MTAGTTTDIPEIIGIIRETAETIGKIEIAIVRETETIGTIEVSAEANLGCFNCGATDHIKKNC